MKPVKLTRRDIAKMVRGVKTLDYKERPVVQEMLERLSKSADGRISREELRRELSRLRAEYRISELDAKGIAKAVFGD